MNQEPEKIAGSGETSPAPAASPADDTADYIMPAESFQKHQRKSRKRYRKMKKMQKGESPSDSSELEFIGKTDSPKSPSGESAVDADDYVFAKPRRKSRRMKLWVKIVLIVVAALLAIILAATSTVIILNQVGKNQLHNFDDVDIVLPTDDDSELSSDDVDVELMNDGKTIIYNGETYTMNEEVASIVFIGVDQNMNDDMSAMADAIYIFALDSKSGKLTVIGVNRDTLADVNVYSENGEFIDTEKMQISYSYSFGSDRSSGSENTVTSASRLFFGMPFRDYFTIDLDALTTANDAIGGVTLTSSMTFVSPLTGQTVHEGDEITLYGSDAEYYIRTRDTETLSSNSDRMQRQQEYIKAFVEEAVPRAKDDPDLITYFYNLISSNSATSLTVPKITYLATSAASMVSAASEVEFRSITGTYTAGDYAELNADDKALLELMLDVFYTQQES